MFRYLSRRPRIGAAGLRGLDAVILVERVDFGCSSGDSVRRPARPDPCRRDENSIPASPTRYSNTDGTVSTSSFVARKSLLSTVDLALDLRVGDVLRRSASTRRERRPESARRRGRRSTAAIPGRWSGSRSPIGRCDTTLDSVNNRRWTSIAPQVRCVGRSTSGFVGAHDVGLPFGFRGSGPGDGSVRGAGCWPRSARADRRRCRAREPVRSTAAIRRTGTWNVRYAP